MQLAEKRGASYSLPDFFVQALARWVASVKYERLYVPLAYSRILTVDCLATILEYLRSLEAGAQISGKPHQSFEGFETRS